MEPRIEILPEKKLIGKRLRMTYSNNKTVELWKSFMPGRKEIKNSVSADLFSMQVYDDSFDFRSLNPHAEFEKWAAVEVSDFSSIPDGMETHSLKGGLYVVFLHKGPASEGSRISQFIFGEWLPKSEYELDKREHFELLGEKYKNNEPDSEEEIWIPVKRK